MEHPNVEYSATFTCHSCKTQSEQRCIEWPPKIYACGNQKCGAIFKLSSQDADGSTTMKLIRHKD